MFDTIIIGGGPAGYIAAERLGQEKKKVLLIEKQLMGGTCLNTGCIPTKTLLNSAKTYVHAKEAARFGILTQGVSYDWQAVQNWKTEVVTRLRSGIESMMKHYGVETIEGKAEIIRPPSGESPAKVSVKTQNGKINEYEGKTILVCAGSAPVIPPIPGIKENPKVLDSTGLLEITDMPKQLAIIGGGVIGIEFAGLFSAFDCQVTVIEALNEIIPFMDREQSPVLRRAMKNVKFELGCKVEKIEGNQIFFKSADGVTNKTDADIILLAAGRSPVTDNWGAAAAGVDVTKAGVAVDDLMRTNIPGIWAAGDVTGKSLLAHSAYRMAEVAAADILSFPGGTGDKTNRMRYNAIPWAVYGITEAAGVGITEQEADAKGIKIIKASLPKKISGRFVAENTFSGIGVVKVIADALNRRILGIHAVGSYAPEFIWGGAALIEQEFRIEDVKQLIFPHPTVSELIRDVVWEM
nr:dehydrogenase [uncultured bacterium]